MRYTSEKKRAGRIVLKNLLPLAEKFLAENPSPLQNEAVSEIGKAAAPYHTKDNLDSVLIYHGERGGWIADLVFRDCPVGVGDVIGTPVGAPFATRQAAVDAAVAMIAAVLSKVSQDAPIAPDRCCEFYDRIYKFPGGMLDHIQRTWRETEQRLGGKIEPGYIRHRLREVSARYVRGGEVRSDLTQAEEHEIWTVLSMAVVNRGMIRYPDREALPPAEQPLATIH